MNARRITITALLTSAALLAAAEAISLADPREGDTISEQIADLGRAQPLAIIAVGAVAVHFAGGVPALQRAASRRPLLALSIGALVGAAWPLKGFKRP